MLVHACWHPAVLCCLRHKLSAAEQCWPASNCTAVALTNACTLYSPAVAVGAVRRGSISAAQGGASAGPPRALSRCTTPVGALAERTCRGGAWRRLQLGAAPHGRSSQQGVITVLVQMTVRGLQLPAAYGKANLKKVSCWFVLTLAETASLTCEVPARARHVLMLRSLKSCPARAAQVRDAVRDMRRPRQLQATCSDMVQAQEHLPTQLQGHTGLWVRAVSASDVPVLFPPKWLLLSGLGTRTRGLHSPELKAEAAMVADVQHGRQRCGQSGPCMGPYGRGLILFVSRHSPKLYHWLGLRRSGHQCSRSAALECGAAP